MGILPALAILIHLGNSAHADSLVVKPKASLQFRPAATNAALPVAVIPTVSPNIAPAAATFGAVRGYQMQAGYAPAGAPFAPGMARTVGSSPSSNPSPPMDISRFFQMPMGNDGGYGTNPYYSNPYSGGSSSYTRSTPDIPSTVRPIESASTQPAATQSKSAAAAMTADGDTESKVDPPPEATKGQSQSPPSPRVESESPKQIAEQQPPAVGSEDKVAPPPEPPPVKPQSPPPLKTADEFPQCGRDNPTTDPVLVRKMFASILRIRDTVHQSLRQNEKVWFANPTLSLKPVGDTMHIIIGHPMHKTDAPSFFCQNGNTLHVEMDVSHDLLVREKAGNTIVANLTRTGYGSYRNDAADGSLTTYALENAAPATANTAMAMH